MECGDKAGTDAGYQRHRRAGERACAPCLSAHSEKTSGWSKDDPERRNRVHRNSKFKRVYGISLTEYDALLESQKGLCAICFIRAEDAPKGILFVDHCHTSGKVRGLLCSLCNFTLGNARDNVEILRSAALYLEASR